MKALTSVLFVALLAITGLTSTAIAQDDAPAEATGDLSVTDAKAAKGVEERQPVEAGDTFAAGDKVWIWIDLNNRGEQTEITVIWKRDDKKMSETTLKAGRSPSWKTWARKTLRKAGAYTVDIAAADGTVLKSLSFTVTE